MITIVGITSSCNATSSADGAGTAVYSSSGTLTTTSSTTAIIINPSSQTIDPNASLQFSASGGTPPYTYTVTSGGGTMNSSTGLYVAPSASSLVEVAVYDVNGNYGYASITVGASTLTISAASTSVETGGSDLITGSGGTPPYTYTVVGGGGSIDRSGGLFTAPSSTGLSEISVEDATGAVAYVVLTITGS